MVAIEAVDVPIVAISVGDSLPLLLLRGTTISQPGSTTFLERLDTFTTSPFI